VDDMDAIFDYVVLEDQDAAFKMLDAFEKRIGQLAQSPYIGAAIRTDEAMMIASGYRYLVVSPYLIFYRVTDGEVRIGRVLHSRQDWLQLLFGPR
ncbi:MAG: type II toxin-antitoxin system RelE/ParE family toxin, partial [Clostridiales bacterium]|nr:type II toxin-antitoxin system RelE/ParE family toxin [Clostridiales bacterium]